MYTITVKAKYRNNLLYYLKNNKIEASAHFDPPLHQQSYLKKFKPLRVPRNVSILNLSHHCYFKLFAIKCD